MKSTGNTHVDQLILNLKNNMESYMRAFKPSYTQADIDDCVNLLYDYTNKILFTKSKTEAMDIVKSTVLNLNTLNNRCNNTLIETYEREQIVEIILLICHNMKFNLMNDDITEEWREW
jgi:hypothetical protein